MKFDTRKIHSLSLSQTPHTRHKSKINQSSESKNLNLNYENEVNSSSLHQARRPFFEAKLQRTFRSGEDSGVQWELVRVSLTKITNNFRL